LGAIIGNCCIVCDPHNSIIYYEVPMMDAILNVLKNIAESYAVWVLPPHFQDKESFTDEELEHLVYCFPYSFWV